MAARDPLARPATALPPFRRRWPWIAAFLARAPVRRYRFAKGRDAAPSRADGQERR